MAESQRRSVWVALAGTLVVCVGIVGVIVRSNVRESRVAKAIQLRGGIVEWPSKPQWMEKWISDDWWRVCFAPNRAGMYCMFVDDVLLANIAELSRLEILNCPATDIGDDHLPHLTHLQQLKILDLPFTRITDRSIDVLSQLSKLKSLNVKGTGITNAGFKELKKRLPKCTVVR